MNKKIVILMSSLAVIAVATVGFSAWVVGVQQTETTSKTSVSVDAVTNDTQYLTADMSGQEIIIAEEKEHVRKGLDIIGSESIGADSNALEFTFASLSVTLGKKSDSSYTKVVIELDAENNNFLTTETNLVGREGVSRTYLKFTKVEVPFIGSSTFFTSNSENGYTTYTLDTSKVNIAGGLSLKLSWGTYFGENKSPVEYYNGLNSGSDSTDVLLKRANNASSELTTMKSVLENSENKITFKLSLA